LRGVTVHLHAGCTPMADIIYIGVAAASFGLFTLAVYFCERL
jgi:hypothetical protein